MIHFIIFLLQFYAKFDERKDFYLDLIGGDMENEETFRKYLQEIRPSQLYLSEDRLKSVKEKENLEPLPVKRIGEELFFTDGHHRAFTLWKKGKDEVEVYEDEDDMDWLEYLICVDWCMEENIASIKDLEDKIVSEEKFQDLWIGRCQQMHDEDDFQHIHFEREKDPGYKSQICESILRSLPEWFGIEKAIKDYVEGVKDKSFTTVYLGNIPVGFISIKDHNQYTSEAYVLGIVEELHGRGIGKRLFEKVERELNENGKKFFTVKTLSDSREDGSYKKTRGYYESVGFYPLEEFKELWSEENPCLLMVKVLG